MDQWRAQLSNPRLRQYEETPKHIGVNNPGRQGTSMDLSPHEAQGALTTAAFDPQQAKGAKAPSLWALVNGEIYRFMWDNSSAWHGYPADEKPPQAVLNQWLEDKSLTNAAYKKFLKRPNRGN